MNMRLSELKIELTQQCPLACVHCSTNSNRKQTSMLPKTVVIRLLAEAAELGVEKVVFTGGEPLVCPYLPEAIEAAASRGIVPTLYTSGIVDNELTPMSLALATSFTRRGLTRFLFSLYSHRPEVHESVTRYGTHAATLLALRNAISTGVPTEVHFVAMKRNFRDLPELVDLAASMGAERLSVLRFVPQGRGRNISSADDLVGEELKELAKAIVWLRRLYPQLPIRAGSPFNILNIGYTPCNAAQGVLIVNHRGDIFPCDAFKNVDYRDPMFGNVLQQDLRDIWEKSLFLSRVRGILVGEKGEMCRSCQQERTCQSGCLAQKVIRAGWQAAQEPDPGCLLQPLASLRSARPVLVQIVGSDFR
jgi:pyrroloquinoline quinone biosynthesis protein E